MVVVLAHLKTVDNTVVNGEGISGYIIGGLPAVTILALGGPDVF